jgi:hypothetical protein
MKFTQSERRLLRQLDEAYQDELEANLVMKLAEGDDGRVFYALDGDRIDSQGDIRPFETIRSATDVVDTLKDEGYITVDMIGEKYQVCITEKGRKSVPGIDQPWPEKLPD